jgi:stringent starvation protein B
MLRTYVIEAVYDWIVDHELTPYILVNTDYEDVAFPEQYVDDDGKVLLNISPEAIDAFQCHNNQILFNTAFDGKLTLVNIPVKSVLELYSKEDSQGLYTQNLNSGISIHEREYHSHNDPTSGIANLRIV